MLTRLAGERVVNDSEVIGIDSLAEMIPAAKRKASKAHSKSHIQLGLVEPLRYEDKYIDIVVNSRMLRHLPPELKQPEFGEYFGS